MGLEATIQEEMKAAMRARNEPVLRALRAIKAALLLAKTSGAAKPEDEQAMLLKLAKQRKESMEIYRKEGRDDLAKAEEEELAVIQRFLPEQMDDAALEAALRRIIEQTGAASMADMGKVMGAAAKQLAGRADNRRISEQVRKLLAG